MSSAQATDVPRETAAVETPAVENPDDEAAAAVTEVEVAPLRPLRLFEAGVAEAGT